MTMERNALRQKLLEALKQSPYRGNVRRISLFGSQLHGNATKESDIDLLIELREPMSMFRFIHLERDLTQALGRAVDLQTPMSLSRYFRSDVLREAQPLFEAAA